MRQEAPIPFWDAIIESKVSKDKKIMWLLECCRSQHATALLLAKAMREYGRHKPTCDALRSPVAVCGCGYRQALAVARELVKQEAKHDPR